MADEQDRDPRLLAQPVEVGQDLLLAGLIERGQRLVEEEQAGAGQERAADSDPLPLAAGQGAGPAVEQRADAEQIHHLGQRRLSGRGAGKPSAIEQVAAHGQMRKQAGVLKHIADAAAVARNVDAPAGIEQGVAIEHDAAAGRPDQARDRVDHRRLAGAGPAEYGGHTVVGREPHLERQRAQRHFDVDLEHQSPRIMRATGRASSSEAMSVAKARPIETRVRRSAPVSPPGTWV